MKRYALISVSDKSGIAELASELVKNGFEIISTGGTAKYLSEIGIPIIPISNWTGFPEIMDGRVKTLHPKVHGGILADLDLPEHLKVLTELNINPIEIVVVNLYPFEQTVSNPKSTDDDIIENIDIGGPTLIRSAAKNFKHVSILCDKRDYVNVVKQIAEHGKTTHALRKELAYRAFSHVEKYDRAISEYFAESFAADDIVQAVEDDILTKSLRVSASLIQPMRYGENPHQKAGYYSNTMSGWTHLHGKPLSYNNLLDLDAALRGIVLFDKPSAMIFKHTNPCGIGCGENLLEAYQNAFNTDPLSPFGGIIVVNKALDVKTVNKINEIFSEIIIAPAFDTDALEVLKKRKDRRLVMYNQEILIKNKPLYEIKSIISGFLVQEWDTAITDETEWKVVSDRKPDNDELDALRFAWKTVALLKSNAIAITTKENTIGLGIGQTSRVDSTEIAIKKAKFFGHDLSKAVCASDGFFPFRDSIELLAKNGIKAIIQPGGSKGDDDVIRACDELNIALILTGKRHFKH